MAVTDRAVAAAMTDAGAPVAGEVSTVAGRELVGILGRRPLIVTGMPARPLDSGSLAECAEQLRGSVDAVLSGDSGRARVQYPPSYRAALIRREGLRAWLGVNARDRNRTALHEELAALAAADVGAVHCVTGDHTALGHRADARAVFDLEGTTLVPAARSLGLLTSVAESPAAPPRDRRAARTVQKQRAGAQLCLPQYVGEVSELAEFIDETRVAGGTLPFLAGVPVVIDHDGARVLASFPGTVLPPGYLDEVLSASDPFTTGVRLAVELGTRLLAVEGVAGIVAAGGATPGSEVRYARALAAIGRELGGGAR
ncbi:methylenetetrahydrofolate reductase [Herbiconiux moechotypicola]|uniref:Methylenetetrahydrofolate reductase C-terminal domain-containing protein n=1 Tax=Herbiconiux moechotypicola TaxID=637393 RepID=A0ABN3D7Y4_9MICO|nr:methylenetetrahydrofolate reductase [Herbiconiux moechotypicola]MCS5728333.1 methylenetetrahydrofolate reductase [Herbiconiux moechotypicola]